MFCNSKITEIYFFIDEFYKNFVKTISDSLVFLIFIISFFNFFSLELQ